MVSGYCTHLKSIFTRVWIQKEPHCWILFIFKDRIHTFSKTRLGMYVSPIKIAKCIRSIKYKYNYNDWLCYWKGALKICQLSFTKKNWGTNKWLCVQKINFICQTLKNKQNPYWRKRWHLQGTSWLISSKLINVLLQCQICEIFISSFSSNCWGTLRL